MHAGKNEVQDLAGESSDKLAVFSPTFLREAHLESVITHMMRFNSNKLVSDSRNHCQGTSERDWPKICKHRSKADSLCGKRPELIVDSC